MIAVERSPEPEVLRDRKNNWKTSYLSAVGRVRANPTKTNVRSKKIAENKYNNPAVKRALKKMFHGKCAYCESHISHIAYPHIEHYKPKARYEHLCFEWENLLLACGICNGTKYKGDKFPGAGDGGPYVNPTTDEPDDFFDFVFDAQTGVSIVRPKKNRARTTETQLGLNRKDLLIHRNQIIMHLAYIADNARQGDNDAILLLLENTDESKEYAAFARAFCRKIGLL